MRVKFLHTEGFRLAALYAGMFAVSALILGAVTFFITGVTLRNQIVQFATADIAAVRAGYVQEGIDEAIEVIAQRMATPGASDYFLLEMGGKQLAGNLPLMAPNEGEMEIHLPGPENTDILGVGAVLRPGLYVFSGSDLSHSRTAQAEILRILLWPFLGALILAGLGGALISRGFLARTDAIATACRAIMDGNLKARIPVRGIDDELDRLSATINDMLDRIAALMENLRQVTNDIAHDLRTPVTHLRHRLERARETAQTPRHFTETLDATIAEADGILAQFTALLRIAEIEGGARRAGFSAVDLKDVLHHVRDMLIPVAEDFGHSIADELHESVIVRGDKDLLVQLFTNLVENAIIHTPAGTAVTLSLSAKDDAALIVVEDNGPGVPPDEHKKLFQRLYRREASRSRPGYGLGLSLVAAITELHGGTVRTVPRVPGFRAEVSLPLPRAALPPSGATA